MARDRERDSRRLKAARALAGVTVPELAARAPVKANGITANLIGETERQERDARPMELRVIAEGLGLPEWLLTGEITSEAQLLADILDRVDRLADRVQTAESEQATIRTLLQEQAELLKRQTRLLSDIETLVATLPSDDTTRELIRALGDGPSSVGLGHSGAG